MGHLLGVVLEGGGGRRIGVAGGRAEGDPAGERGVSLVSGVAIMTGPAPGGASRASGRGWAAILGWPPGLYM
jgi:hypothetical protein